MASTFSRLACLRITCRIDLWFLTGWVLLLQHSAIELSVCPRTALLHVDTVWRAVAPHVERHMRLVSSGRWSRRRRRCDRLLCVEWIQGRLREVYPTQGGCGSTARERRGRVGRGSGVDGRGHTARRGGGSACRLDADESCRQVTVSFSMVRTSAHCHK